MRKTRNISNLAITRRGFLASSGAVAMLSGLSMMPTAVLA